MSKYVFLAEKQHRNQFFRPGNLHCSKGLTLRLQTPSTQSINPILCQGDDFREPAEKSKKLYLHKCILSEKVEGSIPPVFRVMVLFLSQKVLSLRILSTGLLTHGQNR